MQMRIINLTYKSNNRALEMLKQHVGGHINISPCRMWRGNGMLIENWDETTAILLDVFDDNHRPPYPLDAVESTMSKGGPVCLKIYVGENVKSVEMMKNSVSIIKYK